MTLSDAVREAETKMRRGVVCETDGQKTHSYVVAYGSLWELVGEDEGDSRLEVPEMPDTDALTATCWYATDDL